MKDKNLFCRIVVLFCFVYEMHGMEMCDAGPINNLPNETLEKIIISALMLKNRSDWIANQKKAVAVFWVNRKWYHIANGPGVVKKVVPLYRQYGDLESYDEPDEYDCPLYMYLGPRYYQKINETFNKLCEKGTAAAVEKWIKRPYVDVNFISNFKGPFSDVYNSPLGYAITSSNVAVVELLIAHNVNINRMSPDVLCIAIGSMENNKNMENKKKIFECLCNAGAWDNGQALRDALDYAARYNSHIYDLLPLFKKIGSDPNYDPIHETALHCLLTTPAPRNDILQELIQNFNVNPHIAYILSGKTAYTLAHEWEKKGHPEYLTTIQTYDKGIEWYKENQGFKEIDKEMDKDMGKRYFHPLLW